MKFVKICALINIILLVFYISTWVYRAWPKQLTQEQSNSEISGILTGVGKYIPVNTPYPTLEYAVTTTVPVGKHKVYKCRIWKHLNETDCYTDNEWVKTLHVQGTSFWVFKNGEVAPVDSSYGLFELNSY